MYFRFLETDDDYFFAGDGAWPDRICGLNLPKDVLQKIYMGNAKRVLRPN